MQGHIHLSTVSVIASLATFVLASFIFHQLSLKWGSSENENVQLWGKALAAGFGF